MHGDGRAAQEDEPSGRLCPIWSFNKLSQKSINYSVICGKCFALLHRMERESDWQYIWTHRHSDEVIDWKFSNPYALLFDIYKCANVLNTLIDTKTPATNTSRPFSISVVTAFGPLAHIIWTFLILESSSIYLFVYSHRFSYFYQVIYSPRNGKLPHRK